MSSRDLVILEVLELLKLFMIAVIASEAYSDRTASGK